MVPNIQSDLPCGRPFGPDFGGFPAFGPFGIHGFDRRRSECCHGHHCCRGSSSPHPWFKKSDENCCGGRNQWPGPWRWFSGHKECRRHGRRSCHDHHCGCCEHCCRRENQCEVYMDRESKMKLMIFWLLKELFWRKSFA